MKNSNFDLYQIVTDKIIEQLEAGKLPWVKPWKSTSYNGLPYNGISNRAYSGVNVMLLWLSGFSSPDWYTSTQLKAKGWRFNEGEKPTMIVFTKPIAKDVKNVETGEVEKKGYQVFRYYRVFNRDQTDAPKVEQPDTIPAPTPEDVEQILGSLNLAEGVIYGGDRACYMPSRDGIRLPNVGDFKSEDHFKSTALHEGVHATGHKSRLDRDQRNAFGSAGYAFEELIAEIGSAMACAQIGLQWEELRHADYISSWLTALKNDKKMIVQAASRATKAVKYLIPEAEVVPIAEAA